VFVVAAADRFPATTVQNSLPAVFRIC